MDFEGTFLKLATNLLHVVFMPRRSCVGWPCCRDLGDVMKTTALIGAAAMAVYSGLHGSASAQDFDGKWAVKLTTISGSCDASLSTTVGVSGGRIADAGMFLSTHGSVDDSGHLAIRAAGGGIRSPRAESWRRRAVRGPGRRRAINAPAAGSPAEVKSGFLLRASRSVLGLGRRFRERDTNAQSDGSRLRQGQRAIAMLRLPRIAVADFGAS